MLLYASKQLSSSTTWAVYISATEKVSVVSETYLEITEALE